MKTNTAQSFSDRSAPTVQPPIPFSALVKDIMMLAVKGLLAFYLLGAVFLTIFFAMAIPS